MSLPLNATDRRKLDVLMARRDPCLLCGSKKVIAKGVFVPTQPALWGGVPDKTRLIGYCLCKTCRGLPAAERSLRIEAKLAAGIVGSRN